MKSGVKIKLCQVICVLILSLLPIWIFVSETFVAFNITAVDLKLLSNLPESELLPFMIRYERGRFLWTLLHGILFGFSSFTAVLAFLNYRLQKDSLFLFVGYLIILITLSEGYLTLVVDQIIPTVTLPPKDRLMIPLWWLRTIYPVALIVIVLIHRRSVERCKAYANVVMAAVSVVTIAILAGFTHLLSDSKISEHNAWIDTPEVVFIPLICSLFAMVVLFWYYRFRPGFFSWGLLLSFVPTIAGTIYLLPVFWDIGFYCGQISTMLAMSVIFMALCIDYVHNYRAFYLFLSVISHHLRTPIHAFMGLGDLLVKQVDGPLNEAQIQCVQRMLTAGESVQFLVADVLDLARMATQDVDFAKDSIEFDVLVKEEVEHQRRIAEQKKLDLVVMCPESKVVIQGDARKLKQIVRNLISNAIKSTDMGRVAVDLSVDQKNLSLEVSDTGKGMDSDQVRALFEPVLRSKKKDLGFQINPSIGLVLSKSFARLHRGDLTVKSQLNHGATFVLTLPLQMEKS